MIATPNKPIIADENPTENSRCGDGSLEITNRLILSIAIPMTIGYLSTPLMGLVDTAVIGQLGNAAMIGGLAIGTILVDIAFFTFNFLRAGTVGLTAQAYGAEDDIEIQACLMRALGLALLIGIIVLWVSPTLLSIGLWFMDPGPNIAAATKEYFNIRMFSAPFTLANYALFGWFVGRGSTKIALFLQLFINGLNILLSIILGLVLNWGIYGVAMATVIAEFAGCLVACAIAWQALQIHKKPSWSKIIDPGTIGRMMAMNGDIMIRSFSLLLAFGYFTSQGAKFGENILAANAVLMHFFFVSGYFLDGLAVAGEQIVGRAIGAVDRLAFIRASKLILLWSLLLALILSLIYLAIGKSVIDFITVSPVIRQVAKEYFLWAALVSIAGVVAFVMDGIYIGATWSRAMSITMVASLTGFIVFWKILEPHLGNNGLWLALYSFLLLRGVSMSILLPYKTKTTFDELQKVGLWGAVSLKN